jgi:hypothetical protein
MQKDCTPCNNIAAGAIIVQGDLQALQFDVGSALRVEEEDLLDPKINRPEAGESPNRSRFRPGRKLA